MKTRRLICILCKIILGLSMVLLLVQNPFDSGVRISHAAGPLYVAPGGSDSNSCLSPGSPCATINGAIGKATEGDTVYVAAGTFTGAGDQVVLIDKDITLSGGWDGAFNQQSGTSIIDGEDARRGIYVNGNVSAIINHLTIQYGYTDEEYGGGIYNAGTLTITSSTINDNFHDFDGYGFYGGGGIYNSDSLTLNNSTVSNNTSTVSGGGVYCDSGTSTDIMDSHIYANTAIQGAGGGIEVDNDGTLSISRSWVVGNIALNNDGGGFGANNGSVYVENSIIAGNTTADTGGGFWLEGNGPFSIVNSHIIGNHADEDGAAIVGYYTQIEITNTLIISNTGNTGIDSQWDSDAEFSLNFCDTYDNSPDGTVNVTIIRTNCLGTLPEDGLDPLMMGGTLPGGVGPDYADEWLNYDYRLLPGSPAIDAGTPSGAPAVDIEGNPRDLTPDLGAYEVDITRDDIIYVPIIQRNYCQLLYADDFSDPESGWPVGDDEDFLLEYNGGEYRILIRPTESWILTRPGFQASSYIVSVDLRNPNNIYGSYGIAFGVASDWSSLYTFEIFPDGWYGIYRWDPESYAVLAEEYSSAINQGSAMNQIKIERNGASIKAYANGQLLKTVSDGTYIGIRYLGLAAFSYDDPNVDVRFDNFTVYPIGCSGMSSTSISNTEWLTASDRGSIHFSTDINRHPWHE